MANQHTFHSPNILIYLEADGNKIRLADVLYQSATLYEQAEIPPKTKASLVISVDGEEDREEILLDNGINKDDTLINFTYLNPEKLNGRQFSQQ